MIKTLPKLYQCHTVNLLRIWTIAIVIPKLTQEFEINTWFMLASTAPSCAISVFYFCTDHPAKILPKPFEQTITCNFWWHRTLDTHTDWGVSWTQTGRREKVKPWEHERMGFLSPFNGWQSNYEGYDSRVHTSRWDRERIRDQVLRSIFVPFYRSGLNKLMHTERSTHRLIIIVIICLCIHPSNGRPCDQVKGKSKTIRQPTCFLCSSLIG